MGAKWRRCTNDLCCEAFATFGAASGDHLATVFGFHTLTKAVSAFFRGFVWLISAFHQYPLKKMVGKYSKKSLKIVFR